MPTISMVKMPNGHLRGFGQDADQAYKRYKARVKRMAAGEIFTLSWKWQRNQAHHRKFFALVGYVADNSDVYDNKEKALVAIKLAAGHCDFVPDPKGGGLIAVPKSISFDSLDQDAFDAFYNDAINGTIKHILPHMNRVAMETALANVAEF